MEFIKGVCSSNEVSCHVLADKLGNYATTVCSKDINNYSKSSLTLASHSKRESVQWKCYLKDPECVFNNLVKPSSCQLYNEKTLCHSYQIVQNDVETLCNTKPRRQIGEPISYFQSSESHQKPQSSARPEPAAGCVFKTAKEELSIHYQKKARVNSPFPSKNQQHSNYGAQQRSLGACRGVFNKFVSPVASSTEDGLLDHFGKKPQDRDVDKRLESIDPKMVELIRNEIMETGAMVTWDDIAGLEFAKTTIQEMVIWPLLRPDIFTGLRRPPKGILLFGPPGTGKTLIGKCIASQSHSTFFSISASSLTSKWIGDGEKMVRALFAVARCHQPAVVFIDEIDSLLSQRSDSEHESSRRIKTEFLVQLVIIVMIMAVTVVNNF
uniref:AAA+ ATPase domain-containing protein n=1 Tax=Timema monikensis TaxID=170555 RepID=A0A7R9EC67_9NEOP|nr:unnamed protein product [Timema monikensis]